MEARTLPVFSMNLGIPMQTLRAISYPNVNVA